MTLSQSFWVAHPTLPRTHGHTTGGLGSPSNRRLDDSLLTGLSTNGSNENELIQIKEMDDLIWSLSLEPNDKERRDRLAAVFAQKFDDYYFCNLFDRQLTLMGDQVKARAAEAAAAVAAASDNDENSSVEEGGGSDGSSMSAGQEKLPEVKQLWALIDLMIQKKTLVKRAREAGKT